MATIDWNPGGKKMILTLDGGGMRGMISVAMLAELETMTGKPAYELFDMVVGTSTGAIIAAGLAVKMTAQSIVEEVYRDKLPNAFTPGGVRMWLRYLFNGLRNLYPVEPFQEALIPFAQGKRIRDVTDMILLLTSKDVRSGHMLYIVNRGPGAPAFADYPLSGAVAASGAAPIYFPPTAKNLIDGGVGVDANPCLAGAVEAMEYIGAAEGFIDNQVTLISLGTGYIPMQYEADAAARFWLKDWVSYIISESLDDAALQQTMSTRAIYRSRMDFRRYNPELTREKLTGELNIDLLGKPDPRGLSLDSRAPDQVRLMEEIGREYARRLDWSRAEVMPWDTVGGHDKPSVTVLPIDWTKTPYQ